MPVARCFTRATGDRLRLALRLAFFREVVLPSRFRRTPFTVRFALLLFRLAKPRTDFFRDALRAVDFRAALRLVRFIFAFRSWGIAAEAARRPTLSA
jgi:hypothetical protein